MNDRFWPEAAAQAFSARMTATDPQQPLRIVRARAVRVLLERLDFVIGPVSFLSGLIDLDF